MPEEEDDVATEVDINDPPAFVTEGTEDDEIEIGGRDVSKAHRADFSDWIEPAKDVVFTITKAVIDTYTPKDKNDWKTRSLKLYLKVDKAGVDGKGRYAGKVFFPRILVDINTDAYDFSKNAQGKPTKWYEPEGDAWGDQNAVFSALGFPTNPTPPNTKAFRDALVGKKLMANIDKKHRQVKDGGKYVDIPDEFENELSKYRAVKVTAPAETSEAAVA